MYKTFEAGLLEGGTRRAVRKDFLKTESVPSLTSGRDSSLFAGESAVCLLDSFGLCLEDSCGLCCNFWGGGGAVEVSTFFGAWSRISFSDSVLTATRPLQMFSEESQAWRIKIKSPDQWTSPIFFVSWVLILCFLFLRHNQLHSRGNTVKLLTRSFSLLPLFFYFHFVSFRLFLLLWLFLFLGFLFFLLLWLLLFLGFLFFLLFVGFSFLLLFVFLFCGFLFLLLLWFLLFLSFLVFLLCFLLWFAPGYLPFGRDSLVAE